MVNCGDVGLCCAGFLTAVLSVQPADAAYRLTYEAISYSVEDETEQIVSRQKNVMLIDEGRLRTVGGDAEGFDLIADLKKNTIYVLDAAQQSYAEIPFPSDEEDSELADGEDNRSVLTIQVDTAGEVILKHGTERYSILEDSTLIREIWTTQEIKLGFDFMQAMDGLERAFQQFAPAEDYPEFSTIFRQVRGVPLRDIQYYPFGRDVLKATRIDRVKPAESDFQPPEKFARRALRDLAGVESPDEISADTPGPQGRRE